MTQDYHHIPVLLEEVLELLDPQPAQQFVDATLGGGGYTEALLARTAPSGRVLALDLDHDALAHAKQTLSGSAQDRLVLVHSNFSQIGHVAHSHDFGPVQGIVADIGLSSYELDQSGRGISFQRDEPLDMRFDQSSGKPTAAFLLAESTEAELAHLFKHYSEERYAPLIAKQIVQQRAGEAITRTPQLVEAITKGVPARVRFRAQDSVRRIFQALRIAVNAELENLEAFLPAALDILAPGGVLAVVTFHSLEDRIVKQFFKAATTGCICPKDFPICQCGQTPAAQSITKKPIIAGVGEQERNSRSLSAKLRAIRKI